MTTETVAGEQGEYPKSWRWQDDGNLVSGRFLRFEQGMTKDFGAKVILVLDIEGEERSVWLTTSVLHNRFRDELERRGSGNLEVGERIVIERGADKVESENGRSYWPHKILFPDRPSKSPAELFGLNEGLVVYDEKPSGESSDEIPF